MLLAFEIQIGSRLHWPHGCISVSLPKPLQSMIASSCDGLSPSLLALPNHFTHIDSWSYLEQRPILQDRMLRQKLNGMIHVPRLKHTNAAELFLGST
jgi:hypothetical protein